MEIIQQIKKQNVELQRKSALEDIGVETKSPEKKAEKINNPSEKDKIEYIKSLYGISQKGWEGLSF
jgi:hypothetical protein